MRPLFTPGPWVWNGPYTLCPVDRTPDDQCVHTILTVENIGYGYIAHNNLQAALTESDANQHLIAAAPDLYDAAVSALAALSTATRLVPTSPHAIAIAKLQSALEKANCSSPIQHLKEAA